MAISQQLCVSTCKIQKNVQCVVDNIKYIPLYSVLSLLAGIAAVSSGRAEPDTAYLPNYPNLTVSTDIIQNILQVHFLLCLFTIGSFLEHIMRQIQIEFWIKTFNFTGTYCFTEICS